MADPDRVIEDAERFCREYQLGDHARQYMMSRSLEVIDAVVYRAHGWRHTRNPSNAVSLSLRRHHVVTSGDYPRDVRSS
eukprot:6121475-Alexandrium_andersonii.AAC.1